jgi:hypothetical protein
MQTFIGFDLIAGETGVEVVVVETRGGFVVALGVGGVFVTDAREKAAPVVVLGEQVVKRAVVGGRLAGGGVIVEVVDRDLRNPGMTTVGAVAIEGSVGVWPPPGSVPIIVES